MGNIKSTNIATLYLYLNDVMFIVFVLPFLDLPNLLPRHYTQKKALKFICEIKINKLEKKNLLGIQTQSRLNYLF